MALCVLGVFHSLNLLKKEDWGGKKINIDALAHTILRTIPISGGTCSQMGKKQAMRAAVKAGMTATARATLQCCLNIHPCSLAGCSSPCAQISYISFIPLLWLLLQQSSFQCLFSFLSSFCLYSQTDSYITKVLRACSQITICTLQIHSSAFLQLWAFLEQGVQCLLGRALYFLSLRHWCNKHDLLPPQCPCNFTSTDWSRSRQLISANVNWRKVVGLPVSKSCTIMYLCNFGSTGDSGCCFNFFLYCCDSETAQMILSQNHRMCWLERTLKII